MFRAENSATGNQALDNHFRDGQTSHNVFMDDSRTRPWSTIYYNPNIDCNLDPTLTIALSPTFNITDKIVKMNIYNLLIK